MKIRDIPIANRLQAIETILDRNVQLKNGPNRKELEEALRFIRSIQRTFVGSHYVRERSLKQFNEKAWRKIQKANWAKVKRERAIKENGTLVSTERPEEKKP